MQVGTAPYTPVAITASDTVNLLSRNTAGGWPTGFMVATTTGVVVMVLEDGTTFTFTPLVGVIYPFRFKRINSTGTGGGVVGLTALYLS